MAWACGFTPRPTFIYHVSHGGYGTTQVNTSNGWTSILSKLGLWGSLFHASFAIRYESSSVWRPTYILEGQDWSNWLSLCIYRVVGIWMICSTILSWITIKDRWVKKKLWMKKMGRWVISRSCRLETWRDVERRTKLAPPSNPPHILFLFSSLPFLLTFLF